MECCTCQKRINESRGKTAYAKPADQCVACYRKTPEYREAKRRHNKATYTTAQGRRWNLQRNYGITPDEFARMSETQGHKCAICDLERELVVDHCHGSGQVRGLLCSQCNSGIGMLQESVNLLTEAVVYLNRFKR